MTRTTTVRPRSHERQQCEANTADDTDDEYVFTVVADESDGDDLVSHSVRLNPGEGRRTDVRRRITQRPGTVAETTAGRSSGPVSAVTRRDSLCEGALDSLVEAWYHHDHPSTDPEAPPTEAVDHDGDESADRYRRPFSADSGWHRCD